MVLATIVTATAVVLWSDIALTANAASADIHSITMKGRIIVAMISIPSEASFADMDDSGLMFIVRSFLNYAAKVRLFSFR